MVEMGLDPELFYFVSLLRLHLHVATVTDAGFTESKKLCTIVRNIVCDDPTFPHERKRNYVRQEDVPFVQCVAIHNRTDCQVINGSRWHCEV